MMVEDTVAGPARRMHDAGSERDGHFGAFGGQFVPETLMPALA